MKIAVSIIIPVYNSAAYLRRCIDSIINQDYNNFEVILVDDGSIDSSLDICRTYSRKDSRIRVYAKPNGGVSSARNLGLDNAQGDYVFFVDSDDWIFPDSLSALMNACRDADLVAGSMRFARSGSVLSLSECDTTLEGQQLSDTLQDNINHHTFNSPCAKLFLREIIERHNIRFDEELCFGEDALFVNTYLLYVNKLKVIPLLCYNYCDSGNDIYIKYSCSFTPIYHYYVKISLLYQDISNKFDIVINQRDLVGVVFNIALNCIVHNGIREKALVREFLTDCRSVKVLKSRRSIYLDVIIFLAQLPLGYGLILFVKCVEKIKSLNKS